MGGLVGGPDGGGGGGGSGGGGGGGGGRGVSPSREASAAAASAASTAANALHCIAGVPSLADVLALRAARAGGFDDAVLVDRASAEVSGTTRGNVFCVKFGVIYTTPLSGSARAGVMRRCIFAWATAAGLAVREVPLTKPFLRTAAEVFVTTTADEVVGVRQIDDARIGGLSAPMPGPVTRRLMALAVSKIEESAGIRHEKRALLAELAASPDAPHGGLK